MPTLAQSQSSSLTNPALVLYASVKGFLTDLATVSYRISDPTGAQQYPAQSGAFQAINVLGQDHLDAGTYLAEWPCPADAALGTWTITWQFQALVGGPVQMVMQRFNVVAMTSPEALPQVEPNYVSLQTMRDEGVPVAVNDVMLFNRIQLASRFVDRACRRFFYPRAMTLVLDGSGGPRQFFSDPIIAVGSILFEDSPFYYDAYELQDEDAIRIYNRHISEGLTEPDDRNNPKIELYNRVFLSSNRVNPYIRFPRGQQNIQVKGLFGYTDPDGSPTGSTPILIQHVTKLITVRELAKVNSTSARFAAQVRSRIVGERTRDQSFTLSPRAAGAAGAFFTGDPEIDSVLAYYLRPPTMGAA